MLTIPGNPGEMIISCNYYDADGSPVVDLFDNPVLGWAFDEGEAPTPVITGTLPPTGEGPQWAHFADDGVYVPDMWRGKLVEFFTWLATKTGTERKVRANFQSTRLKSAMDVWSANNQTMFNPAPF